MRIEGLSGLGLYEALRLAYALVKHRARTSIVEVSTGLHGDAVRSLYKDLHGSSPSSGPLLTSAEPLTRKPHAHLHAAIFAALYRSLSDADREGVDAAVMVRAFELYLRLAPQGGYRLGINEAWIIARDLHAGLATPRRCRCCGIVYLVSVAARRPPRCPLCAPPRRAAIKSGRNAGGGHRP